MLKKGLIIGMILLLMSASLIIVPSETKAAENMDALAGPPAGITPTDIAWNPDGSLALMVGTDTLSNGNSAALYDPHTDSWQLLTGYPSNFVGYTLQAVTWAEGFAGTGAWVTVGATRGSGLITAYYLQAGSTTLVTMPTSGNPPINVPLLDVASDEYGNVMVVNYMTPDYVKFFNNQYSQWSDVSNSDNQGNFFSVGYDLNNNRYYIGGQVTGGGGLLIHYSDAIYDPTIQPNNHHQYWAGPSNYYFSGIYWNNDPALAPNGNYAFLQSTDNKIYRITPIEKGVYVNISATAPAITYSGMAWNTDTWDEATIIGSTSNGVVYQYSTESKAYVKLSDSPGVSEYCVAYKPPASPGWPMVLSSSGAVKIQVTELDISSKITANSVFPHLYWIGLNDTAGTNRMDQQIPVEDWYNFTGVFNYSQGYDNCEVIVQAWYDWGAAGGISAYPSETDSNRVLAFRLSYNIFTNAYSITYPGSPEITIGIGTDSQWRAIDGTQDHWYFQLPIYLGAQIRNATGHGFGAGDPDYDADPNIALADIWSWDFNITVRDSSNPTAWAKLYGEFGVDEEVSISVVGNPSGNTPPGSSSTLLSNPSQITYSANTDYWVNVSIPNLLQNGVGPANIAATYVEVMNMNPYADGANSEISAQTFITAANTDTRVWGGAAIPVGAPSNGTVATGPWVSDYNAAGLGLDDYTVLDWWVTVPGGTGEGVYWAVITVTIDS